MSILTTASSDWFAQCRPVFRTLDYPEDPGFPEELEGPGILDHQFFTYEQAVILDLVLLAMPDD